MRVVEQAVCVGLLSVVGGILFTLSPIRPVPIQLPPLRAPPNTSAPAIDFGAAKHVGEGQLVGPESLAVSDDGATLYTGLGDGRVVRITQRDGGPLRWQLVARTGTASAGHCGSGERWGGPSDSFSRERACGRPLGMRLTKRRHLLDGGKQIRSNHPARLAIDSSPRFVNQIRHSDSSPRFVTERRVESARRILPLSNSLSPSCSL